MTGNKVTDKLIEKDSDKNLEVDEVRKEIDQFINPSVYHNQIALPYCQWDLRDFFNPIEREKAKKVSEAAKTWENLTQFAKEKGLDSISLGLVIMEEQAKNAKFTPSDSWFQGEYLFGKELKSIFYNPFPIMSIVKKYDRVYREKLVGADGITCMGNRYYPTEQERAKGNLKERYFIYDRYLVGLLEKTKSGYELLHSIPFLFSPKKATGVQFLQKYNQTITAITGWYGVNVAPFIFANHLSPVSEVYKSRKNEALLSQVVTLQFEGFQTEEQVKARFVGKEIASRLENWYAQYTPAPMEMTLQMSHLIDEDLPEEGADF